MSASPFEIWQEQNREFLALAIDDLHARLEGESGKRAKAAMAALGERMEYAPALVSLAESFDLASFEYDVVLLCMASQVDPRFRIDPRPVTVGFLLESLPDPNWSAIDASGPLRSWGIVELHGDGGGDAEAAGADATIRLAGDIARYLLGFDPRDAPLEIFRRSADPTIAVPSVDDAAHDLVRTIELTTTVMGSSPAVEIHGAGGDDRLALAVACAEQLGASVASAAASELPPPGAELDRLLLRWSRLGRLMGTKLLIDASAELDDGAVRQSVARAISLTRGPLFIAVGDPTTTEPSRPLVRREARALGADERADVWARCVEAMRRRLKIRQSKLLDAELIDLATQFRLSARVIHRICVEAEALHDAGADGRRAETAELLARRLREGCWRTVRARLDPLAERVPLENIADVELPEEERAQLEEIENQIRVSHQVDTVWGIGHGRPSGLTALFAGPSGTGKTHAAAALAVRLGLDLYRVNVAAVLSKYIGETEQNLDRIFEAAAIGGVIILFDEADALFGKRSEVRDSHDRYANLGTAYLLQRIENAPTPTILTTNMKEGLDPAFMRRLDFVVDFPFPLAPTREQIWHTIYPPETPTRGLEPARLAAVALTGGGISNAARRGAYIAAAEGDEHVHMKHVSEGVVRERRKAGSELTPDEREALFP